MFDTQDVDCIHKVLCLYCNLYPEFLLSYLLYILILVKLKLVKTKHTHSKHTKKEQDRNKKLLENMTSITLVLTCLCRLNVMSQLSREHLQQVCQLKDLFCL